MRHARIACTLIALAASGLLLAGCGGPPDDNPLLREAEAAYQSAANDSLTVANAPVALEEAEESVTRAQQLLEDDAEAAAVSHQAYLAKQRVHIAEAVARLNAAEQAVKRAEAERQEVVLAARQQEAEEARQEAAEERRQAEAARQEAAAERQEAERAKAEAQAAIERANELARQIEELQARQTERGLILTLSDVLFDVGEATLKPGGLRAVGELAAFLNDYPERTVLVEGFTDATGGAEFNQELSQRRAASVQAALLERGIASNRIRIRGYGEEFPVATNDTAAGRQQNRRIEVIISDDSGTIPERSE